MKKILLMSLVVGLLNSSVFAKSKSILFKNMPDTSKAPALQNQIGNNNDFDNLLKEIDCDDTNYEKDMKGLKKNIEEQLNSMIKRLLAFKKDTIRSKPLIAALTSELKTYESEIDNEASMLFWSYGVASMQGERVVSRNCYYLTALRRKRAFIKAINEKIEGSLLMGRG
jgi:hypothetical protein